ncbi:hypothetical protein ABCR94_13870 [Streptomyces sp. 21So2-11]|uniref:DNA polymerase Y family protein n=1 Tax=Streptomyces sp. 21So2-11 TaxID=3144408 RepID=UPI00321BE19E
MTTPRVILHCHFHMPPGAHRGLYQDLLAGCEAITPQVQAIPPDSAHLDLTGALAYWQADTAGLAAVIKMRLAALHGIRTTCGAGPNRMIASMATAVTPPGETTVVEDDDVATWLRPRPVAALDGVGPKTSRALSRHGLHTIGNLADTTPSILERILGMTTARALLDRAHGLDPRPVAREPLARSMSHEHRFEHDELDSTEHRRALLGLATRLGNSLRAEEQIAAGLSLVVRYADQTASTRSRTLAEPTHHTAAMTRAAYALYATLGLQRARVRTLTLRAETLRPADQATRQLHFDPSDDKALLIEEVTDRARARFGDAILAPAALAQPPCKGQVPSATAARRSGGPASLRTLFDPGG